MPKTYLCEDEVFSYFIKKHKNLVIKTLYNKGVRVLKKLVNLTPR